MVILTAAVILVGVLCVLNLLFTFGVIRRLREHTEQLANVQAGGGPGAGLPAVGAEVAVPEVSGRTLVGFFSPNCQPCKEQLPAFIGYAAGFPGGRDQVLAVVLDSDEEQAASISAQVESVARVVREQSTDPISSAFGVMAYPTLVLVEDGKVAGAGFSIEQLPATV